MKKKNLILIIILLFLLTGCTQILKDSDNKIVKYDSAIICDSCDKSCNTLEEEYANLGKKDKMTKDEETRYNELKTEIENCNKDCTSKCNLAKKNETEQSLTSNILCKPTNKDVIEIYEMNGVDIKSLPSCADFSATSNYEGLWISIFVKPLAWVIIKTGILFNNFGLSLVLISIAIRALLMPITKKTASQSENLKKAQPEIDKVNKKYANRTDRESNDQKTKETLTIYKKYDINPLSSCVFAIIQIPLLFAFIEAINRTPAIFEGKFLGLRLGLTPLAAIKSGQWWYIIIIILLVVVTYFSMNLNKGTTGGGEKADNQMAIMNKVMVVFIAFASFTLSTAICVYWISSSAFTVFQNLLVKKAKK